MSAGVVFFLLMWAFVCIWLAAHCDQNSRGDRALMYVLVVAATLVIPALGLVLYITLGWRDG